MSKRKKEGDDPVELDAGLLSLRPKFPNRLPRDSNRLKPEVNFSRDKNLDEQERVPDESDY